MPSSREARLVQTFVELADTLVNDFDVVDFLHLLVRRALDGLDAAEAGILLADPGGTLHLMASSNERTRSLELFQLQNEEGPCLDCFHSGEAVTIEADEQAMVSRAMADIATIGILQHRAIHQAQETVEQLQVALTSRITLEQAKGVLAERAGLAMDSFERLRTYARRSNRRISDVAQALIEGTLAPEVLHTLEDEVPSSGSAE